MSWTKEVSWGLRTCFWRVGCRWFGYDFVSFCNSVAVVLIIGTCNQQLCRHVLNCETIFEYPIYQFVTSDKMKPFFRASLHYMCHTFSKQLDAPRTRTAACQRLDALSQLSLEEYEPIETCDDWVLSSWNKFSPQHKGTMRWVMSSRHCLVIESTMMRCKFL